MQVEQEVEILAEYQAQTAGPALENKAIQQTIMEGRWWWKKKTENQIKHESKKNDITD